MEEIRVGNRRRIPYSQKNLVENWWENLARNLSSNFYSFIDCKRRNPLRIHKKGLEKINSEIKFQKRALVQQLEESLEK